MMSRDTRPPITYRARRHLWVRPGEFLVCPNGHRLRHNGTVLGGHEAFTCQYKAAPGAGECGAKAYVLLMPGGLRFLAEVTLNEMLHMRDSGMNVEQALAYLQGNAA